MWSGSCGGTASGRGPSGASRGSYGLQGRAAGGRQTCWTAVLATRRRTRCDAATTSPTARRGRPTSLSVMDGVATCREHRLPSVHINLLGAGVTLTLLLEHILPGSFASAVERGGRPEDGLKTAPRRRVDR